MLLTIPHPLVDKIVDAGISLHSFVIEAEFSR
jgi:hypothetical protein